MDDFEIAGTPVRALNHTMSGVPGREMTGLELVGPREGGVAVLEALLAGGERFGLRRGGALSYVSTVFESGWIPSPVPAIYTGDTMRPYREWLGAFGLEGFASIGGSFASENIEDYYVTPWDIGYGHVIKFDHEFVGRAALERLADRPHRRKVWLRWNKRDVADTMVANLSGDDRSPKSVDLPVANFTHFQFDEVRLGERPIGLSTFSGYTVNVGQVCSLAMVDEADAVDGSEVTVVWGQAGDVSKPGVDPHAPREIRATISTSPLI
jgi:glycine cleavage system aminomethyltransferase T